MSRLYADENFDYPVVEHLRRLGHDVLRCRKPDNPVVTTRKYWAEHLAALKTLLYFRWAGCNGSVKGDLIAMAPNRDTLLITGSEDSPGLAIMLDLAAKAQEDPRPMVPIPLRLDGDEWVDWLPGPDHPLSVKFRDLARGFFASEYSEQTNLLHRLHQKLGNDTFVASYLVFKKQADKASSCPAGGTEAPVYSCSSWGNGVRTLLPKTEWIVFVRSDNDFAAVATWEKAQQVVGHLMQPTEYYPERVLVDQFPSDEELARLGKAEP
jgi:hypothetical protein